MLLTAAMTMIVAAYAGSGDSTKSGDVAGNLPIPVYLLIPLALALALLTAFVLGPRGEPAPRARRSGGISRMLGRRAGAAHGGQEGEVS